MNTRYQVRVALLGAVKGDDSSIPVKDKPKLCYVRVWDAINLEWHVVKAQRGYLLDADPATLKSGQAVLIELEQNKTWVIHSLTEWYPEELRDEE